MASAYIQPKLNLKAFNCPSCYAFAQQDWLHPWDFINGSDRFDELTLGLRWAFCLACNKPSMWVEERMVWPVEATAPPAHLDMPPDIAKDYEEARSVSASSPRSAAALLRLCVQKLCTSLGEPGKNINDDIGNLVKKGLSATVQQALDFVRVVGNEQVHPGSLDVRDNPEIATELFILVNFIVDDQISKPKAIADLYAKIPAQKLKGITDRDKPKA